MDRGPAAAAQLEVPVVNNEQHFRLTWDVLREYERRAATVPEVFLHPQALRVVVVSVDPAGGGQQSQEAFVAWLVAGRRFALLTARTATGHRRTVPFATVPLAFVLALLRLVADIMDLLRETHRVLYQTPGRVDAMGNEWTEALPFQPPKVVVVVESNFAYGSAVYQQMMYLVERSRGQQPNLVGVDIVFATPVYAWDLEAKDLQQDLSIQTGIVEDLRGQLATKAEETNAAWLPEPRWGFSLQQVRQAMLNHFRELDRNSLEPTGLTILEAQAHASAESFRRGMPRRRCRR